MSSATATIKPSTWLERNPNSDVSNRLNLGHNEVVAKTKDKICTSPTIPKSIQSDHATTIFCTTTRSQHATIRTNKCQCISILSFNTKQRTRFAHLQQSRTC